MIAKVRVHSLEIGSFQFSQLPELLVQQIAANRSPERYFGKEQFPLSRKVRPTFDDRRFHAANVHCDDRH
jgi:hypothetical protein